MNIYPTWVVYDSRTGERFGKYQARSSDSAISAALAAYGVAPVDASHHLTAVPVKRGAGVR